MGEHVKLKTTINNETGDIEIENVGGLAKGVVKGFGTGLREYLDKAKKAPAVECAIETNVGMYPEGHAYAGQFAVQVMVFPFLDREAAEMIADRVTKAVHKKLRG